MIKHNNTQQYQAIIATLIYSTLLCFYLVINTCSADAIVDIKLGDSTPSVKEKDNLTLVSLNIAHGRKQSLNQLFTSTKTIKRNLLDIASFLQEVDADIVALQEADKASCWSGNFNHIDLIANSAGFSQWAHSSHAKLFFANYGTAILSKYPINKALGYRFAPSPPTMRKGFTLVEIKWLIGLQEIDLDVVSLHLDFSRQYVREKQIKELNDVLKHRNNPLIIMGDFNSAALAKKLVSKSSRNDYQLHTYQPNNSRLTTYKSKRLDWIILSKELQFNYFYHNQDHLSDHQAVVANISFSSM